MGYNFNTSSFNRIGIWGYGVVGQAAVRYFLKKNCALALLEKRALAPEERDFLEKNNIQLFSDTTHERKLFFNWSDAIIPSPGIDLKPYTQHAHKWLSELDIFEHETRNKQANTIAITGTIGKTSITSLLAQTLRQATHVVEGGNIGTSLFAIIDEPTDTGVLELSSFQLEHSHKFAPDLAIITNIYQKHLERHETFENYFQAKYTIMRYQKPEQKALIPASIYQTLRAEIHNTTPERSVAVFFDGDSADEQLLNNFLKIISPQDRVYFYTPEQACVRFSCGTFETLVTPDSVPKISYPTNWLVIAAALDLLGYPVSLLAQTNYTLPAHRLTYIGTVRNLDFYDDSKATAPEATRAAVERLKSRPTRLLLGGISDGFTREELIKQVAPLVKSIHCFGKEASSLANWCKKYGIIATEHVHLQEALSASVGYAQPGDQILLSPSGPSYDQFSDYAERGRAFQEAVTLLKHTPT